MLAPLFQTNEMIKAIMGFLRWLQESCREQGALVIAQPSDEIQPEEKQVENGATASDGVSLTPAIQKQWGLLASGKFFPTKNHGGKITPRYLILHFTANISVSGTVEWFQNPKSKASAHIIIGRDGELVQMVPFHLMAWHCGTSKWRGLGDLNSHSVGVEMVNWGKLKRRNGKLKSWAQEVVEYDDAVEVMGEWWQRYPAEQVEVCANLSREIVRAYGLEDVLGHNEIALPAGRKSDPGPAFPLQQVREFCFSDAEDWMAFLNAKNKDGK